MEVDSDGVVLEADGVTNDAPLSTILAEASFNGMAAAVLSERSASAARLHLLTMLDVK